MKISRLSGGCVGINPECNRSARYGQIPRIRLLWLAEQTPNAINNRSHISECSAAYNKLGFGLVLSYKTPVSGGRVKIILQYHYTAGCIRYHGQNRVTEMSIRASLSTSDGNSVSKSLLIFSYIIIRSAYNLYLSVTCLTTALPQTQALNREHHGQTTHFC